MRVLIETMVLTFLSSGMETIGSLKKVLSLFLLFYLLSLLLFFSTFLALKPASLKLIVKLLVIFISPLNESVSWHNSKDSTEQLWPDLPPLLLRMVKGTVAVLTLFYGAWECFEIQWVVLEL